VALSLRGMRINYGGGKKMPGGGPVATRREQAQECFNKLGWLRGLATSVVCTLTMRSFRRVPDRPLRLNRPRMSAPRGRADIPSLSADFSE